MKKFFYLMSLCLCMFAGAAVVTSCGDDDEEEKIVIDKNTLQDGMKESDNMIEGTAVYEDVAEIYTATFDDESKCTSFFIRYVFADAARAQQAWAEYQNESENEIENFSISGNVITWDRSAQFKGKTRQYVRNWIEDEI